MHALKAQLEVMKMLDADEASSWPAAGGGQKEDEQIEEQLRRCTQLARTARLVRRISLGAQAGFVCVDCIWYDPRLGDR